MSFWRRRDGIGSGDMVFFDRDDKFMYLSRRLHRLEVNFS